MEQEFKKLAEESERKYDLLKTEFNAISNKYNKMIDKLSEMAYENDGLYQEISNLKSICRDLEVEERDSNSKGAKLKPNSSINKEKSGKKGRTNSNDGTKINANKLRNVILEDDGGKLVDLSAS